MTEEQPEGGAGPAIAAHSKDATSRGATSGATGNATPPSSGASETVNRLAGQAQENLRQSGETATRAAGQVSEFVRAQPFTILAVTGIACFAIGLLVARR